MRQVWNESIGVGYKNAVAHKFQAFADNFVENLTNFTSESPDAYSNGIEGDNASLRITIESEGGALEKLELDLKTSQRKAVISKLLVRNKGQLIGKFTAASAVIELAAHNFRKFELTAEDMGPGFWPQLGFTPNHAQEQDNLKTDYMERLAVLKPYLPVHLAALVSVELKKFNEQTPYRLSKMAYLKEVASLISNPGFLKECGIEPYIDPENLDYARQSLHYVIQNLDPDHPLKLGNLLNMRMKMNMVLDLDNRDQYSLFSKVRAGLEAHGFDIG